MKRYNKDTLPIIAMNLDLPSILRWCETEKLTYDSICNNNSFWLNRLDKDYPNWKNFVSESFNISNMHPRERYVFLYQLSWIKKTLGTNESEYDIFLKKKINLNEKGLAKVPSFNLPNLENLKLHNNKLTEVPSFNLPNLKDLDLSNNELTEIPSFNFPNLKWISLDNNKLTEVPSFNLPNLHFLRLNNNQLSEIPAFDLPDLAKLALDGNKLTKIPELNLPKLLWFSLRYNELTEETKNEIEKKYKGKVLHLLL